MFACAHQVRKYAYRMKPNVFSRLHCVVITGFTSSYKIIVGVIYIILLCVTSIEVTSETRVRTDCLNFDVSLCIAYKLKNKFQLGEEGIGIGVRECICLGMQIIFAQIWSCFSQIPYKQQVLMLRLKPTTLKQIKVSAGLITNYRSSKLYALN